MSLLMQALQKAERAKLNQPHEDELAKPSEAFDELLSLSTREPSPEPTAPARGSDGAGLSLSPMDAAPRPAAFRHASEPSARPSSPPARSGFGPDAAAPTAASAAAETKAQSANDAGAEAEADADAAPTPKPARASPAASTAKASAAARPPAVLDPRALRLAALCGTLLLVAALFGYLYWRAVYGPGSASALPRVPMPAQNVPSATAPGLTLVVPPTDPVAAPSGPVNPSAPLAPVNPVNSINPAAAAPLGGTAAPGASASGLPAGAAAPLGASSPSAPGSAGLGGSPAPDPSSNGAPALPASVRAFGAARSGVAAQLAAHGYHGGGAGAVSAPSPLTRTAPPVATRSASPAMPSSARPGAANGDEGGVNVTRDNDAAAINPAVQSAYQAFTSGDTDGAQRQYDIALQQDPNDRDALLGKAAVAIRQNQPGAAAASYLRLLELDPSDGEALAGLIGLHQGDAVQSENRLKAVLQRNPDAGPALFALGNLYAQQGRWPEAQQMYFRAFTITPDNADYAFNLAVGLDRLNQGKLAANYYQRALALSTNNPGNFNRAAIHQRLRELGGGASPAAAGAR